MVGWSRATHTQMLLFPLSKWWGRVPLEKNTIFFIEILHTNKKHWCENNDIFILRTSCCVGCRLLLFSFFFFLLVPHICATFLLFFFLLSPYLTRWPKWGKTMHCFLIFIHVSWSAKWSWIVILLYNSIIFCMKNNYINQLDGKVMQEKGTKKNHK